MVAIIVLSCVLGFLVLLALCVVAWWISTANKFVRLRNIVEEAYSTLDACLTKRYDLIPNLVEVAKDYVKKEKDILVSVVNARNLAANSTNPEEKIQNDTALTGTLKTLFAVAEAYPELKSNIHYSELMKKLSDIEQEIFTSRKYYNGTVREYNTQLEVFPASIVAKRKGLERKPLYEVDDEQMRKSVKVQF